MIKDYIRVAAPILVLTAGFLGFAVFGQKADPPERDQPQQPVAKPATEAVEQFDDKVVIEFDGVVVPDRQIRVSAEIAGRITFKSEELRGGRFVTAGTKLIEIDPEFHQLEVKRLEAERVQDEKLVKELDDERNIINQELIPNAAAQRKLEQEELDRIQLLRKQKVATAADLIGYERNLLTAENNLVTLKKQVLQLNNRIAQNQQTILITDAKLNQARRDLRLSVLKAPIDGLIVEELVQEGSFVQRGTELFVLEDTSQVEISCNLTMDEFGWLLQSPKLSAEGTPGSTLKEAYRLPQIPVIVSYDLAGEVYQWDGEVSRLAGTGVDPRTRTVPCRVTVSDPRTFRVGSSSRSSTSRSPRTLLNGMFVEMTAEVVPARQLLSLSEAAVRPGNTVLKYVDEVRRETIPIDVLHRQAGRVLILAEGSSLQEGDELITSPLTNATPGAPPQETQRTQTVEREPAEAVR